MPGTLGSAVPGGPLRRVIPTAFTAALTLGIQRVADAKQSRGLFP
jgi:hypothetical protein